MILLGGQQVRLNGYYKSILFLENEFKIMNYPLFSLVMNHICLCKLIQQWFTKLHRLHGTEIVDSITKLKIDGNRHVTRR
jgi:hypothetical protein